MLLRIRRPLLSVFSTLVMTACSISGPTYNPHRDKSYMVRGPNGTFAVYNNNHRLISHPVEDLLAQMKWRKTARKPPITDVYVVSHGWNYTLPVAIANYHNYMQLVDDFVNEHSQQIESACQPLLSQQAPAKETPPTDFAESTANRCFQPYFIFITWISTVRPLTDAASAVLPFGMDAAVRPLTSLIDKVPAHLVTAWKQSLNAGQNALGSRLPNDYLSHDWETSSYGNLDSSFVEDSDDVMGEDMPVSALIYRLIQMKQSGSENGSVKVNVNRQGNIDCDKPDPYTPDSDRCVSLEHARIHLAGHSYGAKLVALAGMEAIRRWMLNELTRSDSAPLPQVANEASQRSRENNACDAKLSLQELLKDLNHWAWKQTGHRAGSDALTLWLPKPTKPELLKCLYDDPQRPIPVDSLVLFNPAFVPGELSYPFAPALSSAPADTLRFIPRKAIVYTNSDQANGAMFSVRDVLINSEFSQVIQPFTSEFGTIGEDFFRGSNWAVKTVGYPPFKLAQGVLGAYELGWGVTAGALTWGFNTLTDLPMDFLHHIRTNTLHGWFDPNCSNPAVLTLGYFGNAVDFFMPPILEKEETKHGLYRLYRPGLGKTGLNNLAEGRLARKKLWGLAPYYTETDPFGADVPPGNKLIEHPFAPNISANDFCKFSGMDPYDPGKKVEDFSHGELRALREKFFSFDASRVYDSMMPPTGAHGDLREPKPPSSEHCWTTSPECKQLDKRDYTFNFLLNFTKTNFLQTLEMPTSDPGSAGCAEGADLSCSSGVKR